ncbi:MAG: hypothetical protein WCT15_05000, partial [Candidatus Omnitrophota bacterium]
YDDDQGPRRGEYAVYPEEPAFSRTDGELRRMEIELVPDQVRFFEIIPQGPDLERERNIAIDFRDTIIRRAREAKERGEFLILGLDESWIINKSCPQAVIQELERLPENLKRAGLDNVIFVRGKGDDVAIGIQSKQKETGTGFSNIIVLGSQTILRSDEFDKLRSAKDDDAALLVGVNSEHLTITSGVRILEMYLLAMRLNAGASFSELDTSFIKIAADPDGRARAFVFTPVEPYDIEQFREINRIQIEQVNMNA